MRTIIVVNDFDYVQGGASKVAIDTAKSLHNEGYKVILFVGVTKNDKYDFPVISLNQSEAASNKGRFKNMFRNVYNRQAKKKLAELIRKENNPIVHIHGWTKSLSSSIFSACFKNKCETFLTLHDYFSMCPNGGFFNYKKSIICHKKPLGLKCLCTNCDSRNAFIKLFRILRTFVQNKIVRLPKKIKNIITISDFSENILKKNFPKATFSRLYNPINFNISSERVFPEKNHQYTYVGRIDKTKGVDVICEAFKEFKFNLSIIGDGPLFEEYKKKYNYSNISFLGWKKKDEIFEELKKTRLFLFPSRWYEGAPLSILEASSLGIPCMISNSSAAIDFIDNSCGFIFETDNVGSVQRLLHESLDDSLIRKKSDETFKKYYLSDFSNERYVKDLISIFKL